ncbi:biotin holocarboxylase synthetase [Entomophthora muscae]|uniref:Biotin holocarboxylase synthetase n=1 Tax=Entomophthora muscae TaxID=34485 RepID=A0ACC2UBI0_9FUNG|nr:biotin holocarboxylase synthetase [Entomophthora muscae]
MQMTLSITLGSLMLHYLFFLVDVTFLTLKTLSDYPMKNLIEFVNGGGKFIGFCAGSYYASGRCEFEVGDAKLEVIGNRPLKFFPGTCRGATFKGFDYTSEAGARAAYVTLSHSGDMLPIYYNGGGAFVDAGKYPEVETLATYNGLNNTTPNAAVVLCKVGKGAALLSAVHPEYIPSGLYPQLDVPLILNRNKIYLTLKTWLLKLGLEHSGNAMVMELNPTVTSRNTPEVLVTV